MSMRGVWQRLLFSHHPVIGWWWIPHLRAMILQVSDKKPFLMRTNSIGMRSDRDYPLTRPNGRHRVVLLGDSYTAGDGVSNGLRYSDLLEQDYAGLDVMNFGLNGSGTDQQLLIYENLAKRYEADAYVFAPCVTNIARNLNEMFPMGERGTAEIWYRPKPYFTLEGPRLVLRNQPVPNELISEREAFSRLGATLNVEASPMRRELRKVIPPRLLRSMTESSIMKSIKSMGLGLGSWYDDYASTQTQGWRLMGAILERFIQQIDDSKPIIIMPIPSPEFLVSKLPPVYLKNFLNIDGFTKNTYVLDILPNFKDLSLVDRRSCFYTYDSHYTPHGHRVVADAIAHFIGERFPNLLN